MRIALLSDIHANLEALDAVLHDASARAVEACWHLGDVVGYGPCPGEVIARLREIGASGVMGNHDAAAAGILPLADFNTLAATANRWTSSVLDDESLAFLRALPRVQRDGLYTRVHGSLREPLWEYLSTYEAARAHFALQDTLRSIVGHTHLPLLVRETAPGEVEAEAPPEGEDLDLGDERLCINPGGVGQPRDGDPRAAYAVLDTSAETVAFHRVAYDIRATQRLMEEAGLPAALIARLAAGR